MKRIIAIALAPILTACGSLGPEYISQIDQPTPTATTTSQPPLDNDDDDDGFSVKEGDCDDDDPTVNPDATEYCDGVDSDCSGSESSGIVSFYNTAENKWYDRTNNLKGDVNAPASQTLADSGDYHFCDGTFYVNLSVAADMTLRGEFGEVFLDGAGVSQVITNTFGVDLTIQDLTISNGSSPDEYGGGVLQKEGKLTLTDVDFVKNYAMQGGALSVWDTATIAENVRFHENSSSQSGGALDVYYGTYTSTNTSYTSNTATVSGGAVYGEAAIIYEDSPYYEDNFSEIFGAAIYSVNTSHEAQSNGDTSTSGSNCTFLNNRALGGGVWSGITSTLSLDGCDLTDETDPLDNTVSDIFIEDNGFFYNYEGETTVICDSSGCGDATDYYIEATLPFPTSTPSTTLFGNGYLSHTIDTIDTFSYYIMSDTACTPTFSVHEKTPDADWSLIWEGQSGMTSGFWYDYVGAGNVGIATVPGNEYLLGVSGNDACGQIFYEFAFDIGVASAGFGDVASYIFQLSWSSKDDIYAPSDYQYLFTSSVTSSH